MKKAIAAAFGAAFSFAAAAQNVGIGTSSPDYKLEVIGSIRSTSNGYFDGSVGIGTTAPIYKLQVNNGGLGLYNTTDDKYWSLEYSSGSNILSIRETGTSRLAILNGGNVGIGTTAPTFKLDVAGSGNFDGPLYVNGDKGVVHNASSSTNLKVHLFTTLKFTAILGGHDRSAEGSIGFGGGFTSPPRVFVGDIESTGGTVGELYRVQLIVYGCTTNSCKVRLVNTSPNPVNYDIYYNMVAIGN
jgi:hypothetical protein